jgi:hypothetical protein
MCYLLLVIERCNALEYASKIHVPRKNENPYKGNASRIMPQNAITGRTSFRAIFFTIPEIRLNLKASENNPSAKYAWIAAKKRNGPTKAPIATGK